MTSRNPTAAPVFRRLHKEGFLVLANGWDAGSPRLIESLEAKAIATSSAAVAWSHGYADGDLLPVPLLVATVEEIARVVKVPIMVDVESGYSIDPTAVADTVAAVIDTGGVGINIDRLTETWPDYFAGENAGELKRCSARMPAQAQSARPPKVFAALARDT
jgi:2-methylisocitrate lyase-like PEP mutase family enzyme